MTAPRLTLTSTNARVDALVTDLAEIKAILLARPTAAQVTKAEGKARTTGKAAVAKAAARKAAKEGNPTGACQGEGCTKTGLIHNTHCRACRKAAGEPSTAASPKAAPKVAAVVKVSSPAVGRRSPKAHCRTVGCGLFVKAGAKNCGRHLTAPVVRAEVSPEGKFLTLDDGKRGYRVPADMALNLRKAGLDDATIIKAAKAQGVGSKVTKAPVQGVEVDGVRLAKGGL